jgi:methanogenic corrinoid protein MtbC1
MIRWCSYCQVFLGEVPPFDSIVVTHGICPACEAKMEIADDLGEALVGATWQVRDLMNRIFDCARRADESSIPMLLAEAAAHQMPPASILVGLLQPALYRAGEAWREGGMSIAAEHRLTLWCERFFLQLPWQQTPKTSLDLLIFMMPGNTHTLGPRFAAQLLAARGISTQVVVPQLPVSSMVEEVERLRPRMVGISCALATSLPAADELLIDLADRIDPSWPRRFLLGGFALRGEGPSWVSAAGATVAPTPQEIEDILLQSAA